MNVFVSTQRSTSLSSPPNIQKIWPILPASPSFLRLLLITISSSSIAHCQQITLPIVHLEEHSPVGTFVVNLKSHLPLIQECKSYSPIDNAFSPFFRICNVTFNVFVNKDLDHHRLCSIDRLCQCANCTMQYVVAVSTGTMITVIITPVLITDFDNNAPVFENNKLILHVRENQNRNLKYVLPEATDVDFLDSTLAYELKYEEESDRNMFSLSRKSRLYLTVHGELDREHKSYHRIWLVARGRRLTRSMEIFIEVIDINDNPPKCLNDRNKFVVGSDFTGEVGTLVASDNDSPGPNSDVFFRIEDQPPPNSHIAYDVDETGRALMLFKPLGHKLPQVTLNVVARDSGNPALSAICPITLDIFRSPNITLIPTSSSVVMVDDVIYIADVVRKGQEVFRVEIQVPYVAESWAVETTPSKIYHIRHLNGTSFSVVLSGSLKKHFRNHTSTFTCIDANSPLVLSTLIRQTIVLPTSHHIILYPENNTSIEVTSNDPNEPVFVINVLSDYSKSNSAEGVHFRVDNSDLIDIEVSPLGQALLVGVLAPGKHPVSIKIVGNKTSYEYQTLNVQLTVSQLTFRNLSKHVINRRRVGIGTHAGNGRGGFKSTTVISDVLLVVVIGALILFLIFISIAAKKSSWRCTSASNSAALTNSMTSDDDKLKRKKMQSNANGLYKNRSAQIIACSAVDVTTRTKTVTSNNQAEGIARYPYCTDNSRSFYVGFDDANGHNNPSTAVQAHTSLRHCLQSGKRYRHGGDTTAMVCDSETCMHLNQYRSSTSRLNQWAHSRSTKDNPSEDSCLSVASRLNASRRANGLLDSAENSPVLDRYRASKESLCSTIANMFDQSSFV